jgi:hypothetical protein
MIKFVNNASVTKDVSGSTRGVNIYGFANKISGLGQNARQVLRAINNTDISYNYLDLFSASKEFKFIEPTINNFVVILILI